MAARYPILMTACIVLALSAHVDSVSASSAAGQDCTSNDDCGTGDYCYFGMCTADVGTCTWRPEGCPEYYYPVCGCDGATYGNPCVAASAGISIDYAGACGSCVGDLNDDGVVDAADLAELLGAWGPVFLDPADINANGVVDAADLARLLAAWGLCPQAYVGDYSHSDCYLGVGGEPYPCPEDDIVELTVEDGTLHSLHRNATYNCCPDDIVISLVVEGQLLRMTEEEVLTLPCDCICCYDVAATVVGLAPGAYTVEYCWQDYEQGARCHVEDIVVP